jgi:hypothetical protein
VLKIFERTPSLQNHPERCTSDPFTHRFMKPALDGKEILCKKLVNFCQRQDKSKKFFLLATLSSDILAA